MMIRIYGSNFVSNQIIMEILGDMLNAMQVNYKRPIGNVCSISWHSRFKGESFH